MSSVNRNPSRKQSFLKTLFKLEEFENAAFRFSVDGEHFENDNFTIMMIFAFPSFTQTEIQNDWYSNRNPK